jgi:hypothetical protein
VRHGSRGHLRPDEPAASLAGLKSNDVDTLNWFAFAGADWKFVDANAMI